MCPVPEIEGCGEYSKLLAITRPRNHLNGVENHPPACHHQGASYRPDRASFSAYRRPSFFSSFFAFACAVLAIDLNPVPECPNRALFAFYARQK